MPTEGAESKIGELLNAKQWTLSTAESCTGGGIASRITDVAGASAYFLGAAVCYANQAKQKVLGVREETLLQYGAVSQQTVEEMALGAADLFATEIAVSISGILGPGGGSAEKPVGTTWICVLAMGQTDSRKFTFYGNRAENKHAATEAALAILLENLERMK